jgi:hypothetical protein
VAVFKQLLAQSVDGLRAPVHQEIAGSKHDAVRLLLFTREPRNFAWVTRLRNNVPAASAERFGLPSGNVRTGARRPVPAAAQAPQELFCFY